jgi:23S rRNA U2552 (ribose-2'-O)-methylase RlmE/FtsJ
MTLYKFNCKNIKLECNSNIFNYQKINYNILEKDINYLFNRVNNKPINNIKKTNILKEQINFRINKQYHNLTILNKEIMDNINNYKTLISKNSYNWDKYKLFTNDYEMVYNSKYNNNSIAKKKPLSRSYFKMIEMSNKYLINNIKYSKQLKSLHLAEGPGGFIEALLDLRNKYMSDNNDLYYGISLTTDKNVPGWDKSIRFLKQNDNKVKITTGITGNGDLINIENIKYLHTRFGGKMNIITADGGFNFSINHYIQEYNAAILIYTELVAALGCLCIGGTYIYKIYDMSYKITADILFITQCYFTDMEVIKPLTSRSGNSEKYIICRGFKGILTNDINNLITILDNWININNINDIEINNFIRHKLFYEKNNYDIINIKIIDNLDINSPIAFYNLISKINKIFNDNQINNIKQTLNIKYDNDWIIERKKTQKKLAIEWCCNNNIDYYK